MKPHPLKTKARLLLMPYPALLSRIMAPDATEEECAEFWRRKTEQAVDQFRELLASKEPGSPEYWAIARRAETGPVWLKAGRN